MKKIFQLSAIAFVLVACNKVEAPISSPATPAQLTVTVGDSQTKATDVVSNSTSSEAKVNNFQVFVFDKDGKLDGYKQESSANVLTTTVDCTAGSRDIYVAVNAASLQGKVSTKSDFLATKSKLEDNALDSFIMIGSKSSVTVPTTSTVTIPVNRLASRIVVRGIKNGFSSENFTVKAVCVTNVAGDILYSMTGQPDYSVSSWYNKKGFYTPSSPNSFSSPKSFVCDEMNSEVKPGETYSVAHYFYVYPNGYAIANGGQWSARATKLVVKLSIGGKTYYYPVNLIDKAGKQVKLECNKSYEFDLLTISHYGNGENDTDPEDSPVETSSDGFGMNVVDWSVINLGNLVI